MRPRVPPVLRFAFSSEEVRRKLRPSHGCRTPAVGLFSVPLCNGKSRILKAPLPAFVPPSERDQVVGHPLPLAHACHAGCNTPFCRRLSPPSARLTRNSTVLRFRTASSARWDKLFFACPCLCATRCCWKNGCQAIYACACFELLQQNLCYCSALVLTSLRLCSGRHENVCTGTHHTQRNFSTDGRPRYRCTDDTVGMSLWSRYALTKRLGYI